MSRFITIVGYVLCGVAACTAYLMSKRYSEHIATLAQVFDRIMTSRATRITIFLFWWWLGWHFLYAKTV